jgi:hypothetical protein
VLVCAETAPKLRRLRNQRTRKVQTLFGTITVEAPHISACPCRIVWGFADVPLPPLAELLADRCMPEFRRFQAELSAVRHREKEWVRRVGASPPMRMTASWVRS